MRLTQITLIFIRLFLLLCFASGTVLGQRVEDPKPGNETSVDYFFPKLSPPDAAPEIATIKKAVPRIESSLNLVDTLHRRDSSEYVVQYIFRNGFLQKITARSATGIEVLYLDASGPIYWVESMQLRNEYLRHENYFQRGTLHRQFSNQDCSAPNAQAYRDEEEMRLLLRLQYFLQLL